jgi:thioredoxin 1
MEIEKLDAALTGRKVVVLFHATWCPFCRAFAPVFGRVAAEGAAWAPLEVVVDEDDDPIWERYHIDVVPTVVFFDDGQPVGRIDGKAGIGIEEPTFRKALTRTA